MTGRQAMLLLYPVSMLIFLAESISLFTHHDHGTRYGIMIVIALLNLAIAPFYLRRQWKL